MLWDFNEANTVNLAAFIDEFRDVLLDSVSKSNPPVYQAENVNDDRQKIMDELKRKPFKAQAEVVQAVSALLLDRNEKAAIINAEMGTGKTIMAIAAAAVMHNAGYRRHLVIAPPHLVYKWRREILETVPDARVWVLNGPDTLVKLLKLREQLGVSPTSPYPEFYILGRVRMRMGFHWQPVCYERKVIQHEFDKQKQTSCFSIARLACCPDCYQPILDQDNQPLSRALFMASDMQRSCKHCDGKLWTLTRAKAQSNFRDRVSQSLCRLPTIGKITAEKILNKFGETFIADLLADNIYEFVNLMDEKGNLVFNDRQAVRMERTLAKIEFGFGEGGYQPTEFIKRYLPHGFFDLLIIDEGHEYKNQSSAQGLAMGVLAAKVKKIILLTGTLMGGYADDLFYLLFRILTQRMIEDGYQPNSRGSLGASSMSFLRDHGILKDIYAEKMEGQHRTAKGTKVTRRTVKAPGFGPQGIYRYVLPFTVFLKLKEIGGNILPDYTEEFIEVEMAAEQAVVYEKFSALLTKRLKEALRRRDTTLLGVVLNALLAWPDCCFRPEKVTHPRDRHDVLAFTPSLFDEQSVMPKEQALIECCLTEKAQGRKVLVYSIYSATRDTCSRLKMLLERAGLNVAILRSTISPDKREDWIADKVEQGVDVMITNPELVKTGLDLLDFPTIVFMQTGFNVYTLLQAARRSWRIGQTQAVKVYFLGYKHTSQITCLQLMAQKIAVSQSTSGDMPDSGLDILNPESDSVEMVLAKQLVDC